MTGDKILSIIIPAYNMEKYIEKCCSSLVIKSFLDSLEVLVINDGSTDATSLIAHEFAQRYAGVFRVIDKENGNYGSCINRGIKEASGVFVKILDADDTFDRNSLNAYVKYLIDLHQNAKDSVDMIITDRMDVDENDTVTKRTSFNFPHNKVCSVEQLFGDQIYFLTQHSITYRTDILRKMHYVQTEGISYTDQEWACLPLISVNRFIYYPQCLYAYLVGRSGQTMEHKAFVENIWMRVVIKKNMLKFYVENQEYYPEINRRCLEVLICFSIERIYAQYLISDRKLLDIENIIEFDNYLKENYPDFYDKTSDIKVTQHYPVKFIRYWRDPHKRWKYYIIYSVYVMLHKFMNGMYTGGIK